MTEVKVRHTLLNRGLEGQGYYKQYKSFRNQYSTLVDRVRTCQKQIHHEMFPTPRYIKECSTLPDSHHRRRGNLARVADVYAFCTEAFCLQNKTWRYATTRREGRVCRYRDRDGQPSGGSQTLAAGQLRSRRCPVCTHREVAYCNTPTFGSRTFYLFSIFSFSRNDFFLLNRFCTQVWLIIVPN